MSVREAAAEPQPPAPDRPAPGRAPRTRSLRARLVLWTVAAVVVPTFMAALVMNFIAYESTALQHERSTAQLGTVVAGTLEGRLDKGFGADARAVIDRLREDPRVVLIEVTDAKGNVLYRPVSDPDAWAAIEGRATDATGTLSLRRATGHLALHRTAIQQRHGDDAPPAVEGYLTLGLRDRDAPGMLMTITVFQLGAAGAICLIVVPITAITVARWTAPLRHLRQSVEMLASGQRPQPIRASSRDDLGRLCEAFNAMVRELYAAHGQLADTNKRLETLVKHRTAELRQLNDKLEVEATDKNEFLRAVSHDLNAPLRNIAGMAQMLLMKYRAELPDDAINKLERINANAKHQTELIADLMELSRLRTKDTRPEVVELSDLVARILDSLAFDLEKAGIDLKVEGDFPTLYAERNRLRQVFQNLIDNAIKYMMDSATRTITVTAERGLDYEPDIFKGLDVWRFCVADTGRGIAEQDQEKVFQVFARSTQSGTHQVPGRGVGLASVKTIVEQYGGRIWLESSLGKGTAITFTLPVERVAIPDDLVVGGGARPARGGKAA